MPVRDRCPPSPVARLGPGSNYALRASRSTPVGKAAMIGGYFALSSQCWSIAVVRRDEVRRLRGCW